MARTDQATDAAGTSTVPSLISEYRSQEDAYRAQTRELSRLQQEVFTTAAREANEIVSSARGEVRRVILQARRDLLMLAAQVDVVGNLATDGAAPPEDAPRTLSAARQDLREVLHEASQEFQTVTNYAQALKTQTAQFHASPAPAVPSPPATIPSLSPVAVREVVPPAVSLPRRAPTRRAPAPVRSTRVFIAAFVVIGVAVAAASLWWITHSRSRTTVAAGKTPGTSTAPQGQAGRSATKAPPSTRELAAPVPSVSVAVRRPVWMRIMQDDRALVARLVQPGETFRVTAGRVVSVRAGDAGAVLLSINGAEAAPLGRDGQVLTRSIPLHESNTPPPTAAPAPPPTNSKPPNAGTPQPPPAPSVASPPNAGDPGPPAPAAAAAPPPQSPQSRDDGAVASRGAATPPVRDTPAPTSGTAAAAATPAPANPQTQIARAAERWLDAYYRQDRAAMASLSSPQLILSDERAAAERLPNGLSPVRRDIQEVRVQIFGNDAMYVARVTERLETAPPGSAPGAYVSQMWTLRDGAWWLTNVRIASAAAVGRAVR